MKTIIILTAIVAIATMIYMMRFKKKMINRINDLGITPATTDEYDRTSPTLTIEDWKSRFQNAALSHHWRTFEGLLRHEIRISPEAELETEIKVGQSKIGGHPDLPISQGWFREDNGKSLSFLAQISFNETRAFDKSNQLPTSGILYFFYSAEQEAWGFDPNDKDKFKVFYFDGDITEIKRTDFPSDLPEHSIFNSCKLSFASSVSLPNWESESIKGILSDEEQDAYMELTGEGEISKLLGHSDNIQGTMEDECQLVTNGLYCGDPSGYSDPRAKELKKDADKWMLLFQIDSIDEAGMMWGDVGRVYFWIRKEDLERKDFDKSWFVLQCS